MTNAGERMAALVQHALGVMVDVERKEEELSALKETLNRIQRTDLPELLKELGITEATIADLSVKVSLAQGVDASIPEAARAEAFAWLAEKGYGALVRSDVVCSFGAHELERAQALTERLLEDHWTPQMKMSVPPPTLKAWAKERLSAGEEIPPELFNVRAYDMARLTTIKRKS